MKYLVFIFVVGCVSSAYADKKSAKPPTLSASSLPTKIDEVAWLKWRLLATEISSLANQHDLAVATARDTETAIKRKKEEQTAMKAKLLEDFKFGPSDQIAEDGTIMRGAATPTPAKTAQK